MTHERYLDWERRVFEVAFKMKSSKMDKTDESDIMPGRLYWN
jgi:hypothetical protein